MLNNIFNFLEPHFSLVQKENNMQYRIGMKTIDSEASLKFGSAIYWLFYLWQSTYSSVAQFPWWKKGEIISASYGDRGEHGHMHAHIFTLSFSLWWRYSKESLKYWHSQWCWWRWFVCISWCFDYSSGVCQLFLQKIR